MSIKHWDEGVSWSCLPQAVFSFIGSLIWLVVMSGWGWMVLIVAGILFMACRSGCSWDAEQRRFRSMTGWKWRGRWLTWSPWRQLPTDAINWGLDHTKHSLMNRRGADRAVGIESWELFSLDANGNRTNYHEFTDRSLAHEVLAAMRQSNQSNH